MSIITHVCVGTNDLPKSRQFYTAALSALNIQHLNPMDDSAAVYGRKVPELIVLPPLDGAPATFANGGTIGFAAESRAQVQAFHAAGLANGGVDAGPPGPRDFAPNAYGAYLRDPYGNKICAFTYAHESGS